MKSRLLLPLILVSLLLPLSLRVSAAAEKTISVPIFDFTTYKTADEAWKQVERYQKPPTETPRSREEAMDQVLKYLLTQQSAAEAFAKAFPSDTRSWMARLLALRVTAELRRHGIVASEADDQKKLDEVINSPEAPPSIRGEATGMRIMFMSMQLTPEKPEGYIAIQKAFADFFEKFPDHVLAGEVKTLQMQALSTDPTPEGKELLKKLAAGSDPRQAEAAKAILERDERMARLKSKPVDLAFTAADGQPVDFANLRGKVVLLDFWASWCAPCMAAMPTVAELYGKLHDKGFEIVGICLDYDKGAMEEAMKKEHIVWPQHFDGAATEGKIVKDFGVMTIPSMWLVDKKGMIREIDLKDPNVGPLVEKLLAE